MFSDTIREIIKEAYSLKDCDCSLNDKQTVYCTSQPSSCSLFDRNPNNVVLSPVEKDSCDTPGNSMNAANSQKDSLNSRNSDETLDRSRKARQRRLKATVEAKRDRICADSSSDEDSHKSSNSFTRYQNESSAQKNSSCNRKSRAARTERHVKRLSKEDSYRFSENLRGNKSSVMDQERTRQELQLSMDYTNSRLAQTELLQPSLQSSWFSCWNSNIFPVQKSVENLQQSRMVSPSFPVRSSTDLTKHPNNQFITQSKQTNTYAKPNVSGMSRNQEEPACRDYYDHANYYQLKSQSCIPPDPPPRDSRCRVLSYGRDPKLFNEEYVPRYNVTLHTTMNDIDQARKDYFESSEVYELCNLDNPTDKHDNELSREIEAIRQRRNYYNPLTWNMNYNEAQIRKNQLLKTVNNNSASATCNTLKSMHTPIKQEIAQDSFNLPNDVSTMNRENRLIKNNLCNNRHLTDKYFNELSFGPTEAMLCQRRNDRNDQLTSSFKHYDAKIRENQLLKTVNNNSVSATCNTLESMHTPIKQGITQDPFNLPNYVFTLDRENRLIENKEEVKEQEKSDQDVLERKRTEKNAEEALTELDAIYDSLHLGDEELLDRAELRCMNELKSRQARNKVFPYISENSIDRTTDDMAYRRMHPKERPASLSEMVNQSTLSDISYLIASPILSRKNATDNYLYAANLMHRCEPDVTRDDVVYRSINRANNTLKVIDPQPPFGIPLGPVTTATESDYLHTTPTKLDHPRSLYIPQCEPDIVTDDLAYRSLRKDANIFKITANKNDQETIRDQELAFETKKKPAVGSFSANLYGLTNYDGIHLRREPSFQDIRQALIDEVLPDIDSLSTLTDKRVVSDGELSDYHTRWRSNNLLRPTKIDIGGNGYPVINADRKKLHSYVSPSAQNIEEKRKNEKKPICTTSDDLLTTKTLDNEFCQDCDQTAAYSRIYQDLINLVDEQCNPETEPIMKTNICSNDSNKTDESSTLQIQSLGSHYSGNASQDYKECTDKEDVEEPMKSLVNAVCEKDVSEGTDNNTSDFYLRVADENVKITEALSSVADHLCVPRVAATDKYVINGFDIIIESNDDEYTIVSTYYDSSSDSSN